jgi:hypothetical protein
MRTGDPVDSQSCFEIYTNNIKFRKNARMLGPASRECLVVGLVRLILGLCTVIRISIPAEISGSYAPRIYLSGTFILYRSFCVVLKLENFMLTYHRLI